MDTKLVGDIAVQHAVLEGLKRGWGVLIPVGDRLAYDLVFDIGNKLIRVQVKSAYAAVNTFAVNTKRAKTNRRTYRFERYNPNDFDIALLWHPLEKLFYVMPIGIFLSFRSAVSLPSRNRSKQRFNRAEPYRDAWQFLDPAIATARGERELS
jgi:hypothetical protein